MKSEDSVLSRINSPKKSFEAEFNRVRANRDIIQGPINSAW